MGSNSITCHSTQVKAPSRHRRFLTRPKRQTTTIDVSNFNKKVRLWTAKRLQNRQGKRYYAKCIVWHKAAGYFIHWHWKWSVRCSKTEAKIIEVTLSLTERLHCQTINAQKAELSWVEYRDVIIRRKLRVNRGCITLSVTFDNSERFKCQNVK